MKKALIYLGLAPLGLVAVALVANSIWIWRTGARLEEKLGAIRAAGDPVTLPDLARPEKAPTDNAAVYLERARDDVASMTKELNVLAEGKDYQAGKLTDEDRKRLKSVMEAYPTVFMLLEQAGNCTAYDPQFDYTAPPDAVTAAALANANDFRAVINVLQAQSRLQLAQGQRHEALQTGLLIFRLSRLYDGRLFIVNNLVVCAGRTVAVDVCNRVLRAGPVTDDDHFALEIELGQNSGLDGFVRCLKRERALGVWYYAPTKNWLNAAIFNNDECRYLELVQEQIDLTGKPYAEFVKAVNNFKATGDSSTPLASLWFPAAHKAREAAERVCGVVRCLYVLNHLQRAGIKPEEGAPNPFGNRRLLWPPDVAMDPFTGQALQVKVVNGDWLIYTVGPDMQDDGGDLAGGKDFGVGPVPVLGFE